jgi:3-methyl-2-oxobutanoate hydroxymethyltransferase
MSSYLNNATSDAARKPITLTRLQTMHRGGEKITMLTCYDASFAALLDRCGVDCLLIGDSLGNVLQGHSTTLPVTIDHIAYHTECVARGCKTPLIVADMPFASYGTPAQALDNAAKLMRAGAHMVKLEGGEWLIETVRFLNQRAVPVCAHLGLMPQSVHALGGFKVQGRDASAAAQLKADALALQEAGAQMLVLEAIPSALAAEVTAVLDIPVIGIGAGEKTSGQVLVLHDLLGVFPGRKPKFVKNFLEGASSLEAAITNYVSAVKDQSFPGLEHQFA